MVFKKVNVTDALDNARRLLDAETNLSPALRAAIELILTLVSLMAVEISPGKSTRSGTPPSQDPYRARKSKGGSSEKRKRNPGGQPGRNGVTLEPVDNPDHIEYLDVEVGKLSGNWQETGYHRRQVFDIEVSVVVTEYRAKKYTNANGDEIVADFPFHVNTAVQYGTGVKAATVYNSTYQYQGFARTKEGLEDIFGLPISEGSVGNFRTKAYQLLEVFELRALDYLRSCTVIHNDETGCVIATKRHWVHSMSDDSVSLFFVHKHRGQKAIDDFGIFEGFEGVSVHDCYAPYFGYDIKHALCGAHLLRELEAIDKVEGLAWAKKMTTFLVDCKNEVLESKGQKLSPKRLKQRYKEFHKILEDAELETPFNKEKPKRGKAKQTKSRNLLERFKQYPKETLRFAEDEMVPFTNNQAERDIRMVKLHGKISGCFRSFQGAQIFCRIRSYIATCKKNGISPYYALKEMFAGNLEPVLDRIFKPAEVKS